MFYFFKSKESKFKIQQGKLITLRQKYQVADYIRELNIPDCINYNHDFREQYDDVWRDLMSYGKVMSKIIDGKLTEDDEAINIILRSYYFFLKAIKSGYVDNTNHWETPPGITPKIAPKDNPFAYAFSPNIMHKEVLIINLRRALENVINEQLKWDRLKNIQHSIRFKERFK